MLFLVDMNNWQLLDGLSKSIIKAMAKIEVALLERIEK